MLDIKLERTHHLQINVMIDKFEMENRSAFRKVHRMIDLFEIILKTHTTVILASCFHLNNLSDHMKSLLAWGLRTPSLGLWCVFAREGIQDLIIRKTLSEEEYQWTLDRSYQKGTVSIIETVYSKKDDRYHIDYGELSKIKGGKRKLVEAYKKLDNFKLCPSIVDEDFYNYFFKWDSYVKDGKSYPKKDVVSFRNSYAHGGTPSEEECILDIKAYLPLLHRMLNEKWLHNTFIEVDRSSLKGLHRVYLNSKDYGSIDLFPLLQYIDYSSDLEKTGYYFLNDLKNFHEYRDEICFLNYPDAILLKEYGHRDDFLKVINIHKWKKHRLQSEFEQRISELSQSFKGRASERAKIYQFIDKSNEGFLLLSGNPGIGKSAVFAKVMEELKMEVPSKKRDTHIIEYFIRRNTHGNLIKNFLEYFHKKLDEIYNTNIPYTGDIDRDRNSFFEKLKIVSQFTNKKILIFIDGIDEGIAQGNDNILMYLISENLSNILVLYSSRWRADIERFYLKLPIEHKSLLVLEGLEREDIRGMLYEVTSKYELDKESPYIEEVLKRSEGNPLYVKLLCRDIERGNKTINSLEELPENLGVFYDEILIRFAEEEKGNLLLRALYIFAVAKEYIGPMFVELCLGLDSSETQEVFMNMREVLIEDPKETNRYQIFHESLRDYLIATKKEEINKAHSEMVKFCRKWEDYNETHFLPEDVKSYAAKYYSKHLLAIEMDKEMEALVLGEKHQIYLQYQIDSSNQLDLGFQTYYDACKLFRLVGNFESLIKTSIKAYQLHSKKDELYKDIFKWMKKGDLESLEKAAQRIHLYKEGEKKNLYLLMLYYGINSSILNKDEKYKFLLQYMDRGDEYLEVVENDVELPVHIIGQIIEACISNDMDFSKLLDVKYAYCKANCQQYKPFYEYILEIQEYFIHRNNIKACIEIIYSIEDRAIASICGVNLLEFIYEMDKVWDGDVIDTILDLAQDHDITSIFPYPFESVLKALLETNQENRMKDLIKAYFSPERLNNCLGPEDLIFSLSELIIALYRLNLTDLGDKVLEEYFYPVLKYYQGNGRQTTDIYNLIYNLYEIEAFGIGDQLLELLGNRVDKNTIFDSLTHKLLNNNIKAILNLAQYYVDREEILNIIIDTIKDTNPNRALPLLEAIPWESPLYEPLKDQIHGCESLSPRRTVNEVVMEMIDSIKSHDFDQEFIDTMIDKSFAKKPSIFKYKAYTSLIEALLEEDRIQQGLLIYLHQWVYMDTNKVFEHCVEYCEKGKKKDLLDAFYEIIEKHGDLDEDQALIRLLILVLLIVGEIDIALSWYESLEKGTYKGIILSISTDLFESGKRELSNSILEDLFYTERIKLPIEEYDLEECESKLSEYREPDEVKEIENELLYEKEVIRGEDERESTYLKRMALNKYYTNSREEFLSWINRIGNQAYLELILDRLTTSLIKDDEIELLIKINNLLTEDIYYKKQAIAELTHEMPKFNNLDRVERTIEIANNYIDTYYMKKEFFEWIIDNIYSYRDRVPALLEILLPYLFKDHELLGSTLCKYAVFLLCQDKNSDKDKRLLQSMREIIELDGFVKTQIEYTLDNLHQWIELIDDIEDQEDIMELQEDFNSGKLSEDRMKKKLNRILREYELVKEF